jgi:hypothetical protein
MMTPQLSSTSDWLWKQRTEPIEPGLCLLHATRTLRFWQESRCFRNNALKPRTQAEFRRLLSWQRLPEQAVFAGKHCTENHGNRVRIG